jgi:hypothetical protein
MLRADPKTLARVAAENVQAMTELFTHFGFTGLKVEVIPLPQHLRDWMGQDEDFTALNDDEIAAEMTYLKVNSAQGAFGVFLAVYPAIDLTGTGVDFDELAPGADAQGCPLIGIGDEGTILRFRDLLASRRQVPSV